MPIYYKLATKLDREEIKSPIIFKFATWGYKTGEELQDLHQHLSLCAELIERN